MDCTMTEKKLNKYILSIDVYVFRFKLIHLTRETLEPHLQLHADNARPVQLSDFLEVSETFAQR